MFSPGGCFFFPLPPSAPVRAKFSECVLDYNCLVWTGIGNFPRPDPQKKIEIAFCPGTFQKQSPHFDPEIGIPSTAPSAPQPAPPSHRIPNSLLTVPPINQSLPLPPQTLLSLSPPTLPLMMSITKTFTLTIQCPGKLLPKVESPLPKLPDPPTRLPTVLAVLMSPVQFKESTLSPILRSGSFATPKMRNPPPALGPPLK